MLATNTKYQKELNFVKTLFFNSPIESFDSTTFNFFHNDTAFTYEEKRGDWSVVENGSTLVQLMRNFYFKKHPFLKSYFDSASIGFDYFKRDSINKYLFSMTALFTFNKIEESK